VEYLRNNNMPVTRPELLGLPSNTGEGPLTLDRARRQMVEALKNCDRELFFQIGYNLYLNRNSLSEICDNVIAPAFHDLGRLWEHGEATIYQERRGTEICLEFLKELKGVLPSPQKDAPLAIGATLCDDNYTLPSLMIDASLREVGWNSEFFGMGLTVETFKQAIIDRRPRLVFVSFSGLSINDEFIDEFNDAYSSANEIGSALIVGGRVMTDSVREKLKYTAYCENLERMLSLVRAIYSPQTNNQ
jgi:methanogenic corrinoid protein MtbC1